MADNFLERHRQDYEMRKAAWLRNKRRMPKVKRELERPVDESL
ncbi:dehydrogenase [Hallella colorans]|nr:dehydrogenase [Hallella colorans]